MAQHVTSQRFLPVLAIRGRPDVRLGGFPSLAGQPLAGAWAAAVPASAPAPAAKAPAVAAPAAKAEETAKPPPEPAGGDQDLDAILSSLGGELSSEAAAERRAKQPQAARVNSMRSWPASVLRTRSRRQPPGRRNGCGFGRYAGRFGRVSKAGFKTPDARS